MIHRECYNTRDVRERGGVCQRKSVLHGQNSTHITSSENSDGTLRQNYGSQRPDEYAATQKGASRTLQIPLVSERSEVEPLHMQGARFQAIPQRM